MQWLPPTQVLHRQIQAEARVEQLRGGGCLVEHAGLPHRPEAALGHSRRPHQPQLLPEKACDSPRSLIVTRWAWKMTKQVSGGGPVRERLPRSRRSNRAAAGGTPARSAVGVRHFRFLTTGTQRRVVVSSVPASILTPPVLTTLASHRRVIRASVLMSSVPALSSLRSSWWYPHLVAASSGPRGLQGLVASCVARASRRLVVVVARRHIAASSPRRRIVPLSRCPPILFQEAVRQVRDLGGRCVRAAGHEGTSCCSERQRGTSAARLSRHLEGSWGLQ